MAVDIKSPDAKVLRKMVPLATLPRSHFEAICAQSTIENAPKGFVLFNRGDDNAELIYLLYGEVQLQADEMRLETITAQSETSRFAIAHQIPRKIDAIASTNIRFIRIDPEAISKLSEMNTEATAKEQESYTISEENEASDADADDWMTQLLRKPIFQYLPGRNLQQILTGLREVKFNKGDTIVNQGEQGDFYYVIIEGECLLTRKPSANAKEIALGKLQKLNTFGEDALISGASRNVSVRALTDVKLLRLDKQNFISLILEPSLKYVDYAATQKEQDQGTVLLDVRPPDAFQDNSLKGSINVPFFSLRMHIKSLHRKKKIIVVCDDGKTSAAAAFLLLGCKLNAVVLEGGINKVQPSKKSFSATVEADVGKEVVINDNSQSLKEKVKKSVDDPEPVKIEANPALNDVTEDSLEIQLKKENEQLKASLDKLTKKYLVLVKEKEKLEKALQVEKRNI